tara:strand:+ start:292 stop:759 length:468 start_codon:yes stop_codon:yes gene_type:complete
VIKVSNSRLDYCAKTGKYYEELFSKKVIAKSFKWRKSTNEEDWYKHIDCYVNEYGVDIKGNRHLETIWLEYTNVNGNDGWLRGKAFYIAMFIVELNCFSIYKRIDLLNYIIQNTKEKTNNKKDYLKLYTREKWGKKDQIVKVKYDHIKHLELIKL